MTHFTVLQLVQLTLHTLYVYTYARCQHNTRAWQAPTHPYANVRWSRRKRERGNECEWEQQHGRKEGKEGRRLHAVRSAGERTYAEEMWASTATDDRCHGGGRRMEGWQLPLRHTIRRRWQGWGRFFFCRWTNREECDSSVLLCYSFSHSCTDPGWVYSGSLSCRGSGPSPVPSSSGPSSHSLRGLIPLHAPWDATLPWAAT